MATKKPASKKSTAKPKQNAHRVIVPGFEPLRNKQREYKNTKTGQVISKRQYQKLQAEQTLGQKVTSNEQAAKIRAKKAEETGGHGTDQTGWLFKSGHNKMARFNALVEDYKRAELKRLGLPNTQKNRDKIKVRGDSDSAKRFRSLLNDLKSKDNSPNGRKAKALQALGRRQLEWDMPVGESPK